MVLWPADRPLLQRHLDVSDADAAIAVNGPFAAVHASTINALSFANDPTLGTGTRWLRRNRPTSFSTPPLAIAFNCTQCER
jgi:hypothetical protein